MEQAAAAVGQEPLRDDEVATVLRLARDVAHGVERRAAPVAAYLAGLAAGGGGAAQRPTHRADALREAVRGITATIPPQGPSGSDPRDG
jgi:hypothetical protein